MTAAMVPPVLMVLIMMAPPDAAGLTGNGERTLTGEGASSRPGAAGS
jgi:hypothetical protein